MKKMVLAVVVICAALTVQCKKDAGIRQGVISFKAGKVLLVSGDKSMPARVGDTVCEGMKLQTGEQSYARIAFDGDTIQVYEKTRIDFATLSRVVEKQRDTMEMALEKGTVLCRVVLKINKGDSFRVSSETMVAAVRGTVFLYGVDGNRGVVACDRGVVSVVNVASGVETILHAGQMLSIEPGKMMKAVPIPAGYKYRDFKHGKNPYGDSEAAAGRDALSRPGADHETTGATADSGEVVEQKSRITDSPTTGKSGSDAKDRSIPAEKKVSGADTKRSAAAADEPGPAEKKSTALTAQKKETAETKKKSSANGITGKKRGSDTKDRLVAADKTVPGSGEKGADKSETADDTVRDAKKKAVSPGTAGERRPGGLLVKPRVEEPEAK